MLKNLKQSTSASNHLKPQAQVFTFKKQLSAPMSSDNQDASSIDDLSDDDGVNDSYLTPTVPTIALTDADGYLTPMQDNHARKAQQFLRSPLLDSADDNIKICIEMNRYFDLNKKWNPSTKQDCLQLLKSYMDTENEYIVILKVLIQEYYLNIKAKKFLPEEQLNNIFKSAYNVYKMHESFYKDLEERTLNWQKKPCIFDILTKYSPEFQLYDDYINSFESSFQCLIDSIAKSSDLVEFLKAQFEEIKKAYAGALPNSRNRFVEYLDIKSCFIHVLKWPDCCAYFLNYYMKCLRESSHELVDLKKAFDQLSEMSKKATGIIADSLRLKELLNLQKRIGTKYNIVTKKRNILKEGVLTSIRKYLGNADKFYVILLNDMILITEQSATNEQELKPKYLLDAIGLKVYEDINALNKRRSAIRLPNGLKAENGFLVYVPCIKKKFRFIARNQQEKELWFHNFEIVETANKYQVEINRSSLGKVQPKWIPDDLCQYCCKCKTEFTTINRRHHCRACGYIFCSKCSKMQVKLEFDAENKRSRVCDICYDHMNDSFRCGPPSKEEVNRRLAVNE